MKTLTAVIFLMVNLFCVLEVSNRKPVIDCYLDSDNPNESCYGNVDDAKRVKVRNSMKILSEDSLKTIPNLFEIAMDESGLEEIQPGTFKDLPKLNAIRLKGNNLREIKSGTFVNLRVWYFFLWWNSISVLHEGAFQNVTQVRQMYLENNDLEELKRGAFKDVYVRYLRMGKNKISKIEAGALTGLFPHDKYGLNVTLNNNRLEEIDPAAFDNKDMRVLDLSRNSISVLRPGDLSKLPSLKTIILTGNKIKEVPEGVFSGTSIVEIILNVNEISVIADNAFHDMENLDNVEIRHNKLKEWNGNWFRGTESILISLSYNSFETIPAEAFKNLPNGCIVELNNNQIKSVSDSAFSGTANIDTLLLRNNQLEEWSADLLKNVKIEELDLRGNNIKCPEDGSKSLAPTAAFVHISACPSEYF